MPITDFVTANDGSLVGLSLTFLAASVASWVNYFSSSSSLRRIRRAPSARVSDLRSLLNRRDHAHGEGTLVAVRGHVQAVPTGVSGWLGLNNSGALLSKPSGELAAIVQQTRTCLYSEQWGLLRRTWDLRICEPLLQNLTNMQGSSSSSLKSVPFVLVEDFQQRRSAYVHVNLDGSTHPLPLTKVYRHIHSPWYLFSYVIRGGRVPEALLDEERILPIGKEITAVGVCVKKDGALEIKSCLKLPYFLSNMTKEEMEADLTSNAKILFWSGVVFGMLSLSIFGYAIIRSWRRWNVLRTIRENEESFTVGLEGVPEAELCVICIARRKIHAFAPCGHRVCCQPCAVTVLRESRSPKCPVCRQLVNYSVRIIDF